MISALRCAVAAAGLALAGAVGAYAMAPLERGAVVPVTQYGHGSHPHMKTAELALRDAESSLGRADSDFGGHRSKALALVRQALDEIDRAYAFGGAAHEGPLIPR